MSGLLAVFSLSESRFVLIAKNAFQNDDDMERYAEVNNQHKM